MHWPLNQNSTITAALPLQNGVNSRASLGSCHQTSHEYTGGCGASLSAVNIPLSNDLAPLIVPGRRFTAQIDESSLPEIGT
jgi:hypothetical protein